MIYLDNAATSMHKPPEVAQAVARAIGSMGNAGRGAHDAALDASRVLYDTRSKLSRLFHAQSPMRIAFSANATQSLNTAIKGVIQSGDHVITTALEHNSVLRPLYEMEARGAEITIIPADGRGNIDPRDFEKSIRPNTRAIVCTHASNLTGNAVDIAAVGRIAREREILFIVDASQTAGVLPIDMQKMHIDILCFTGHKGLMGPQGTGGMAVRDGVSIRPLLSGGSGVQTFNRSHPAEMPTALEAGTQNAHGIAGLRAALEYIEAVGADAIYRREQALMRRFLDAIRDIPDLRLYGDFDSNGRCAIVALNLGDVDSARVSDALSVHYGILTRSGGHCAPLMHRSLGTQAQGAVRFSFSHFNTETEIDLAAAALRELAE